jgi:hypothetical protein
LTKKEHFISILIFYARKINLTLFKNISKCSLYFNPYMKILFFFSFLSTISLSFFGEAEYISFHASANIFEKRDISSIANRLKRKHEKKLEERKELCNISEFYDFFGYPKKIIISALEPIPCSLVQSLRKVVIFADPEKPRALAGRSSLYLRNDLFEMPEAKEVLIHELGHIVDLGGVKSKTFQEPSAFRDGHSILYEDDPSVLFYSLSWKNNTEWTEGTNKYDFVTGYASIDPFEDFAESFLFYIEHGNSFRAMAKEYPQLQKKYEFLQDNIFSGKEFFTGSVPDNLSQRGWDATRIGHS